MRTRVRMQFILNENSCKIQFILNKNSCKIKFILNKNSCKIQFILNENSCKIQFILNENLCKMQFILNENSCKIQFILNENSCKIYRMHLIGMKLNYLYVVVLCFRWSQWLTILHVILTDRGLLLCTNQTRTLPTAQCTSLLLVLLCCVWYSSFYDSSYAMLC